MLKWSWDGAWVQKRVSTKKLAIYRRVSYETDSFIAQRSAEVTSACKHRECIKTRGARKRERKRFPLDFFRWKCCAKTREKSVMTGKVERGWLILPQRYSTLELQTNMHSANSWIPSYRIFDEMFVRYFQCKRYRDIKTLEKFYFDSLPKLSWQMNRVHVATNATYRECNAPRWSISLKAG